MPLRVLIVGAGLTGSLCACLLRRELQKRVHIEVWDKARGAGGRMSTSRSPDATSCHSVDLGAQYVTATPTYAASHSSFYQEVMSAGVLRPLDGLIEGLRLRDDDKNFVTPDGMSSLVKHFLRQSEAEVVLERRVVGVFRRGACWEVREGGGVSESFDAVVVTIPVPQLLQLDGDITSCLSTNQQQLLANVSYSSRYALALFFRPGEVLGVPWVARYVSDSDVIRYVSVDDRRRGQEPGGRGSSLVVHTGVAFGAEHIDEEKEAVQPIIMQELYRLLPQLPQPISIKCHKWRFSQVLTSVADCPGHMTLETRPPLVVGGDAFTHSNFDGCVESALSVLGALRAELQL